MDDVDTLPKYGIDNVQFGNFDKLTIIGVLNTNRPKHLQLFITF